MENDFKKMNEEELFDFIRKNKDKFDDFIPEPKHEEKFLQKLGRAIRDTVISIVPYIIKVIVVAIIFWIIGLIAWNLYLNPKKDQMSLSKVSWEYRKFESKHKLHELSAKYLHSNAEIRKAVRKELQPMDSTYVEMKKDLKKNPNNKEIIEAMKQYYNERNAVIDSIVSIHRKINPKK
jgi:Tfp pilus assembly protein PilO